VVTVGLSEVAANGAVAVAAVRIGRTIADIIDALAAAVVSLAAELDAAAAGIATVEREMAPMLARRVEVAEVVRPGVIGQVGPVVGTTPTDLALARLTTTPASAYLPNVDDPRVFDPFSLRGMSTKELMRRIPPDWEMVPSDSGGGIIFKDPRNLGRQIRLMPGYSPEVRAGAINHGSYVVVSQNSRRYKVALEGNPTLK
jgi:hypothetical protein